MHSKQPLIGLFTRLLALGVIACGAVICYSGVSFLSQSTQPFQENLHAIKGTLKELDQTVGGLQKQSDAFEKYLIFLEKSLAQTRAELRVIDLTTTGLLEQTASSLNKSVSDAAAALFTASTQIRGGADAAGAIPLDPFAEQRKAFYSIAGNVESISATLKSNASLISKSVQTYKVSTSKGIGNAMQVVELTEKQIAGLREGSFERMPIVLEALSAQLGAHVKLIDASYGLLNKVSQPVIAVGIGFILLGLRGLLMRQSAPSNSIPVN
jgi:septal ring factor EnvC (AmiA/AmiB activator)